MSVVCVYAYVGRGVRKCPLEEFQKTKCPIVECQLIK